MSAPRPPLTTAAHGSTLCVGCGKRFAMTPGVEVVETEAQIPNRGRVDSVGQMHRGIGTHAVTRLWHKRCLDDFEARNQAYREQVEADREQLVRDLCEAAGMDYDELMARRAAQAEG